MTEVRSEITANVWQVKVAPGDRLQVGDALVILESMKMEIPVESPAAGTVSEVLVAAEQRVEEGDLLVVLDTAGS